MFFLFSLEEERKKERLVWEEEGFMAFVPMLLVFLRNLDSSPASFVLFSEIEEEEIQSLARILKIALLQLKPFFMTRLSILFYMWRLIPASENYRLLPLAPGDFTFLCKMAGFERYDLY